MVDLADRLKGSSFTRVADWAREDLLEALDLAGERERHHLLPAGRSG